MQFIKNKSEIKNKKKTIKFVSETNFKKLENRKKCKM